MSKYPIFDRNNICFQSVEQRKSKIDIQTQAKDSYENMIPINWIQRLEIAKLYLRIKKAREKNKSVILCMGAHPIKNGACLLINDLVNAGLITHIAANGACAIHDWEFARFGKSTECVRSNLEVGEFGLWEETGNFFGASAECACLDSCGWGEKIGELMNQGITFEEGSYKYLKYSIIANCYKQNVPFTIHPGIGQDIIYSHPAITSNVGCSINDFLIFCESVRKLEGGIYLSVGSSVMSPMIFEKALSMSRNVERQNNRDIKDFLIFVNDLADNNWDWSKGEEPPMNNPAYYLRWMKSFHRAGGVLEYCGVHNIAFLKHLHSCL